MSRINVLYERYAEALFEKCGGYVCGYCGRELRHTSYGETNASTATVDHITPISKGGKDNVDNLMLACFSCNALKRNRGIEDLRFYLAMRDFEKRTGIRFSVAQINYLERIGVHLDIPEYVFRYELIRAIMGQHQ